MSGWQWIDGKCYYLDPAQGGAMAARLAFDVLERASERIRSEVKGVARVVYDLTPSNHYGEME